jgi:hypothetical protein
LIFILFKKVFQSVADATKEQERTTLSLKRDKQTNEKNKSKKDKDAKDVKASPSPKPEDGEDETAQRGERKVIRDTDIELKEAGHILVDSIAALGPKQLTWDEPSSK